MYKNPILRCDASGASGHVTAKLSIRNWGAFYKSGAYAWNVLCLTPGGLCVVRRTELSAERSVLIDVQKSAEGVVAAVMR
jgi:hypothetical protein